MLRNRNLFLLLFCIIFVAPLFAEIVAGTNQVNANSSESNVGVDAQGVLLQGNPGESLQRNPNRDDPNPGTPAIVVEPNAIEDGLNTGETSEHVVTISNEGENELVFEVDHEIVSEPERDNQGRTVRGTSRQAGPRRDEIELDGMMFANFQTNSVWGWLDDGMLQDEQLNDENFISYRNADDWNDVDFDEYDVICVSAYNQQFNQQYQQNLERFEEYIANGGGAYYETGNTNAEIRSPGGIYNDINNGSSNGQLLVSPYPEDDNYSRFAEICHMENEDYWEEGEIIEGSSWLHSRYSHEQFEEGVDNGTLEWFQPIASIQGQPDEWGCVAYGYGSGVVMTVGHPSAHCWFNWNRDPGQWGTLQAEILYYLATEGGAKWLSYEPDEGVIAGGEAADVFVMLDAAGLYEGAYEADLHFLSNDDDEPDVVVSVVLEVTGAADIDIVWDEDYGYPDVVDWNAAYPDLFNGHPYEVVLSVENVGTADLVIDWIEIDGEAADMFSGPEELDVIGPGEALDAVFVIESDETGMWEATATFGSNDPDEDEYVVSFRGETGAPPVIDLSTQGIEADLNTGETYEEAVTVSNEGEAPLRFVVEHDIISEPDRDVSARTIRSTSNVAGPLRDELGDLIDQFESPNAAANQYNAGITWDWDNEWMWITNYNPSYRVTAVDPANEYEVVGDFQVANNPMGAAWLNGHLYIIQWSQQYLLHYDTEGQNLGNVEPGFQPTAITSSNELGLLFVMNAADRNIHVFEVDDEGDLAERIGVIPNTAQLCNGFVSRSICWVDKHPDGNLWVNTRNNGNGNELWQLSIDMDEWVAVEQVAHTVSWDAGNGQEWDGVGHDGYNLWVSSYASNMIKILDDGIAEAYWLTYDPSESSLEGGEETDVFVTLDAAGLVGGEYEADLNFISNDPDSPVATVGIFMNVTGAPDLVVEWPQAIGFPDVINWNDAYMDLFSGGPYEVTVEVSNIGTELLIIGDIYTDHDYFTVDFEDEIDLEVRESMDLTITFNAPADEPGEYEAVLSFESDDPDQDVFEIALNAHAFLPPIITLEPNGIEDDLNTGEIVEHTLTMSNEGDALLRWTTESEIISEPGRDVVGRGVRSTSSQVGPHRDDAGDLLGQFQGINVANQYSSVVGWDWDNERMWVTNYSSATAAAYTHDGNYENFEESIRIQPGNTMDGTWLNGLFYLGPWANATVNRYDADGQNIGAIQFPFAVYGLGADVEEGLLFAMESAAPYAIHVYEVDDEGGLGDEIGRIGNHMEYHNNVVAYGLEWVPMHPDGPLWITDAAGGNVYQIAVDVDEWTCTETLQSFAVGGLGQPYCSVAHDGENLWASGFTADDIRVYDDGVAEIRWLTWEPEEGELESGGDQDIFVTLDATGLIGGTYEADLHVLSNDPADPDLSVSIMVEVTGAPDIVIEWSDEIGFPDVINWNDAFDDIFAGGPYDIPVEVSNYGTEVLILSDIYTEHDYFSVDFEDELEIEIDETVVFVFTFNAPADAPGEYNAMMVFSSDDPDEGELEVALFAHAFLPPAIVVEPNAIEEDMVTGEIVERSITISNDGDALLRWTSDFEVLVEPERDRLNHRAVRNTAQAEAGPVNFSPADISDSHQTHDYSVVATPETFASNQRREGPRRDDPPASRYALFQEVDPWGGSIEGLIFQQIEGLDYERFRSGDFAEFPIEDFDVVWVCHSEHSDAFNAAYNESRERFEDWVDGGGAYYASTGTNQYNVVPIHPGGLTYTQGGTSNGTVRVQGADDNAENYSYLAELMNWEEGTVLRGGSLFHVHYEQADIDNIENSDWNQTIVSLENQETPGIAAYNYGRGYCVVAGTTDGHQHVNYADAPNWGSAGEELIYYLDHLANYSQWLEWEPTEGEIAAGNEADVFVILNAEGLVTGRYEGDLHFLSNDPANPDVVVSVAIECQGAPDIEASWAAGAGFPDIIDWNMVYADLFAGGPYEIEVTISNAGTDVLIIDDIVSDNDYFMPDFEDQFEIEVGENVPLIIAFNAPADDPGDYNAVLTIFSDDPDEGEYAIAMHAEAFLPPIIEFDVNAIEDQLFTGDIEEYAINVANAGDALLRFEIESEIISEPELDNVERLVRSTSEVSPQRDDPGELLGQFAGINIANQYSSVVGWDWDNERMWVTNYNNAVAAAYTHDGNYENFEESISINSGNCMDGCWVNGLFYLGNWANASVNRYDADGQNIGAIQFPFAVYGIAADREDQLLLVMESGNNNAIHVYEIDDENGFGDEIGVIENHMGFHGNVVCYGLEWVPEHVDAPLWMTDAAGGNVYQIAVDRDDWTCTETVQSFAVGGLGQPYCSVAHDGEFLWASGYTADDIRVYDDGAVELRWLSYVPEAHELAAGEDVDVIVTLDATGLIEGTYEASMIFHNNDPADPHAEVGILMEVTGAPVLTVMWPEEAGYPDQVNWNDYYQDLFSGGAYSVPATFTNDGTALLIVEVIESDNDVFNADPQEFEIEIGETVNVDFILNSEDDGEYAGTFTVVWNEPNGEDMEITLTGETTSPPRIIVEPQALETELFEGEVEELIVEISNEGPVDLRWSTDADVISEPERDNARRTVRRVSKGPVAELSNYDVNVNIPVSVSGVVPALTSEASTASMIAPRRDEPNELAILLLKDVNDNGFGWADRSTWLEVFANQAPAPDQGNIQDVADFDLSDYDLVVTGEDQSATLYASFMQNREIFEDYVDGGGALAMFTGSNSFQDFQMFSNDGDVAVSRGPNGDWGDVNEMFLNDEGDGLYDGVDEDYPLLTSFEFFSDDQENQDRIRTRMRGNSLNYSVVQQDALPEDAVWYYRPEQQDNTTIIADWPFGSGYVLFTGITGTLFYEQNWQWSSMMECVNLTLWADGAGGARWLTWEPTEGTLQPDDTEDIVVTLNAEGLVGGDYEAELYFFSNDPVEPEDVPDVTVTIMMNVTGQGRITVRPGGTEENNEAIDFGIVYLGYPETFVTSLENIGTDVLVVENIEGNDVFWVSEDVEYPIEIEVDGSFDLPIMFDPQEAAAGQQAELLATTNDANWANGYPIIVMGDGLAAPVIEVDPGEIDEELDEGDTQEYALTVMNSGGSTLIFESEFELTAMPGGDERDANSRSVRSTSSQAGPRRDDAGDLLFEFDWARGVNNYKAGLAWDWDNELMMVTNYSPNWMAIVDPADDYNVVREWQPEGQNPMGATWLDGVFYSVGWANRNLFRHDVEGNNLGNWGDSYPTSVTSSQELGLLFIGSGEGDRDIEVWTPEGERVGTIARNNYAEFMGNSQQRSLCWVDDHPNGQLWVNSPGRLWQMHVDTDNWEVDEAGVNFENGGNQEWDGIGHDGENLWFGGYNLGTIRIFDDGLDELRLITWDPKEGSLEPDEETDIIVTITTEGADGGEYEGFLSFLSNDPETPVLEIPVMLMIHGSSFLTAEEGFEPMPVVDVAMLEFAPAYADGGQSEIVFMLENRGSMAVEITGFDVEGENAGDFTTNIEDGAVVQARDDLEVVFTFAPDDAGNKSATIILHSDAMNVENGDVWWDVTGLGEIPPEMMVDGGGQDGYSWALVVDDQLEDVLTISNEAAEFRADLEFDISIETIEMDEERDDVSRRIRSTSSAAGPMRDDPPESRYALFQETDPWGGSIEGLIFSPIEGLDYERFRSDAFADFAIDDFDVVWVVHSEHSDAFNSAYNNSRERFEEWVDGGGAYFASTGTNQYNVVPVHPGGLQYTQGGTSNGTVRVSSDPDDEDYNYLAELMDWEKDQTVLQGSALFHVHYEQEDIDNVDNSDWNQVIVSLEGQDVPGIAVYSYGNGYCVVGGTTDGHQHVNFADAPNWGSAGEELIYYLDYLSSAVSWLSVDPSDGVVPAGDEIDVVLTVDATDLVDGTDYEALIIIDSNDPAGMVEIFATLHVGNFQLRHFAEFDITDLWHTLNVEGAMFNDEPMPVNWEIGVFTPDGLLAGAVVWDGNDAALYAYGAQGEMDGFENAEAFNFMVWDYEADQEYSAVATYTAGGRFWSAEAASDLVLAAFSSRQLTLDLSPNWNMISINVDPRDMYPDEDAEGPDVIAMWEALGPEGEDVIALLKDGSGSFWAPAWGFNNIPFWNLAGGYQVKINSEDGAEITFSGAPIPADADVPLGPNWNMIAYFPTYDLDASSPDFYVLSPIIDNVLLAKDGAGRFMSTAFGFSNMNPWTAGQGYQVKIDSEEPIILNYPAEMEAVAYISDSNHNSHWTAPLATGSNMSVLVNSINGINLGEGDQIAAYTAEGIFLGSGNVVNGRSGLAIWGDDESTQDVEGALKDEAFNLRLWDADRQLEHELEIGIIRQGEALVYNTDDFVVLDVSVQAQVPTEFFLSQNYPNPFNSATKLSYGMPEAGNLKVNVFDVTGRLVTELVNGTVNAGFHTAVWDAKTSPAGIYMVRMEAENGFKTTRKIMLVK